MMKRGMGAARRYIGQMGYRGYIGWRWETDRINRMCRMRAE
jgi:hypothetical protein